MSGAIRDLATLHPACRRRAEALLQLAAEEGLIIIVTETYRSWERQEELYAQGRTAPGPIVTLTPPGMSWHQWRRAADVAFAGSAPYSETHPWQRLGELGEAARLEWGGRWQRPDRPHFQLAGRCSLRLRVLAHERQLRRGTRGGLVSELQMHLQAGGWEPGPIDGILGYRTEDAVVRLQHAHGIPATGEVTSATIEALDLEEMR